MDIRLFAKEDNPNAVSRVYEESWKHAYQGIIPDLYLAKITTGQWAGVIEKPGRHSLIL